jgi:hypothetical protein
MSNDEDLDAVKAFAQALSRRRLLQTASATIGGVAALVCVALPAEAKMTQKAAAYQLTAKGAQSCANCAVFKAPSSCTLVDGTVVPGGWCRFYASKTS